MIEENSPQKEKLPLSPVVKIGLIFGIGILALAVFASGDLIRSNISLLLQHPESITESVQQSAVRHYESEIKPNNPVHLLATIWVVFLFLLPFIILGLLSKLGIYIFKKKGFIFKLLAIVIILFIIFIIIGFGLTLTATNT